MSPLLLCAVVALEPPPTVVSVVSERRGAVHELRVTTAPELASVRVDHEGSTLRMTISGLAGGAVGLPAAEGPIESISAEQHESSLRITLTIAERARLSVQREAESLSVMVVPEIDVRPADRPSVEQLYPLLFPHGLGADAPAATDVATGDAGEPGLVLGPLSINPRLIVSFIDAESTFLGTPEPTRVSYWQVVPSLDAVATFPLGNSVLKASYEPFFRRGSSLGIVNETTHSATASLTSPLSATSTFDASYRFLRGSLESREVDPGGEFFYGLGRFTRHALNGALAIDTGPRSGLTASSYYRTVGIDDPLRTAYFSHHVIGVRGGARYEVTPTAEVTAGYGHERIPEPESRSVAESSAHVAFVRVDGDLGAFMTGGVEVAFRAQQNPRAASGAEQFRGLTFSGEVRRDFSYSSSLTLGARRATLPSYFENNPFYVSTVFDARLSLPLPLAGTLTAGVAAGWNDYPLDADGLGEPRRDRLLGWSIGLARPLTGRAYLRADYRHDRRRSNIDAFDVDSHAFTVQLGVGLFGSAIP
jgi:hypothetical protein